MLKIDSHHHLWRYNEKEYPWISENLSALKNNFLPTDLKSELTKHGIHFSVAVEARLSIYETEFLLDQAGLHPQIAGVVGWVDLFSKNLGEQLDKLKIYPKLVGIRHRFEENLEQGMLDKKFIQGVKQLKSYDLTYDILCVEKDLPAVIKFSNQVADQKMVLDHIAKPLIKSGTIMPWKEQIRILAQNDNIFCKVSGMVTEADWISWKKDDFRPYMDVVFEAFGMERLMFGSDWPVCLLASNYESVYKIIENYLSQFTSEEQEKVWGTNAKNFYNLKI